MLPWWPQLAEIQNAAKHVFPAGERMVARVAPSSSCGHSQEIEVNEWPNLGSGKPVVNVHFWIVVTEGQGGRHRPIIAVATHAWEGRLTPEPVIPEFGSCRAAMRPISAVPLRLAQP